MKFLAALAQIGPTLGNVEANFRIFERSVRQAERKGAELLVFPELSLTGYFLKDMVPDVAERTGGELVKRVAALSKDVALVVGFVEESPRHTFYNAGAYFEGGRLVHLHRNQTARPLHEQLGQQARASADLHDRVPISEVSRRRDSPQRRSISQPVLPERFARTSVHLWPHVRMIRNIAGAPGRNPQKLRLKANG